MKLTEIASFDVVRAELSWPWLAFDASGARFAFPAAGQRIASLVLEGERVMEGPSFALPADLVLPSTAPVDQPVRDARQGVHAFAIHPAGTALAVTGVVGSASVIVTLSPDGTERRTELKELTGPDFVAQGLAFDRSGSRLWISAEGEKETAIVLVDAATHALVGLTRSAPFAPPATHEIHLHPHEDAILLLAACGQDGTFGRVVRVVDGKPKAVWTGIEGGGIPAGMVGFSADGTRVHLAEADELRTHDWPAMKEIASVQLEDDFVSSYAGAILDGRILVDGQDSETKEDAVMSYDATATKGLHVDPPVPSGMWAGRLGANVLVTVDAKGEPLRGRVVRVTV